MERRGILGLLAAALAAIPAFGREAAAATERRTHLLAIHVDRGDPAVMNMALGNAMNAVKLFGERKETVAVEIVAYGPGLNMLREDTSPVKPRLQSLRDLLPSVILSACNNTLRHMEETEGKKITLIPGARIVPAGIVRLVELQEQGWSYVHP